MNAELLKNLTDTEEADKKLLKQVNQVRHEVDKLADKKSDKLSKKAYKGNYEINLYKFKKEKDCQLLASAAGLLQNYRGFNFEYMKNSKGNKCWLNMNWKDEN